MNAKRLAELQRLAQQQGMELDPVVWLPIAALAARWSCEPSDVRAIPREQLPYLSLPGRRDDRRYHPADVLQFETVLRQLAPKSP